jgi:transcriptional regulator with XRE-family HTH domain
MTTRGDRLRSYLLAKTGGSTGWQGRLVEKSGVKRQTISKWTSPTFDRYPDLETLAVIAAALEVPTFEIIAAMDGQTAVAMDDPRARDAIRSALRDDLPDLLRELGLELPQRAPRGRAGAA